MRNLLSGRLPLDGYLALQANLHHVYRVLEDALRGHAGDPTVAAVHDPRLERTEPLGRDLRALAGEDWSARYPPLPAALRYAERIETVATEAPYLLAAHSYTRYLGDLSGGQILRRLSARVLPADRQDATAFYDFAHLGDLDAYKQRYRAALDALPLGAAEADRFVQEAGRAFELNGMLFEELGEMGDGAQVTRR
jgi:heme oxygenase